MRKILFLILFFNIYLLNAQIYYGITAGVNFPNVNTDFSNIRSLPVDKGGANMMFGLKASKNYGDNITLQSGLNFYKTGFTYSEYSDFYGVELDEFNLTKILSIPMNLFYNVIPGDDSGMADMGLVASIGIGLYANYLLSGTITDEDDNVKKANYNNMKRFEYGTSIIGKLRMFEHFDVFVSYHIGLTNLLKSGTGKIKQNALMMGVAYQF